MVASGSDLASAAGREVLRRGGNAVDAAVAVGFALAVVDPEAGNLGGGGFMLIRMADGSVSFLDYREQAPLAATRDMYLDAEGKATDKSQVGYLAPATPGTVMGLAEAHRKFGRLPWAEVVNPAISMARNGFVLDSIRSARIRGDSTKLALFPVSAAIYLPGGQVPAAGSVLVQPDLARTLEAIRDRGADGFYKGWVADSLVADMARNGGLVRQADLDRYRAYWRQPVTLHYRGYTIFAAPPPSSAGLTMGVVLNVLSTWPELPAFGSATLLQIEIETMRRGFVLRNAAIGDPGFVTVPEQWLLSAALADSLRRSMKVGQATPTLEAQAGAGTGSTTHFSVVDREGNAVSNTYTLNDLYGCGVTVPGTGVLLNDIMDDFTVAPGRANSWGLIQGDVNAIAPLKRPLSSMAPTIVVGRDNALRLVVGSRGGATIITQVLQVISNVIDHDMGLVDAVAAPRIHHQALPDVVRVDRGGYRPEVLDSLRTMGYELREAQPGGDVEAVEPVEGGWLGVSDPRSGGGTAGY
jgi:gamma-glutamyltranspeptidase/glutathione hydrolase